MDSSRFVFSFDEADPSDHALFGGKGAGLAQLVDGGYPVPPGFIISTAACREFMQAGSLPAALGGQLERYVDALEEATSSSFRSVGEPADGAGPLLVSVRSGAPVSMPGMMDTVLNLGINPQRARALAEASGSAQFAAEVMIRFHRMYAEIVLDADGDEVAERGSEFLDGVAADRSETVPFDGLWSAMADAEIEDVGVAVPEDPMAQVRGAIAAVFRSWNTRRATTYRRVNGISDSLGTAVVVQAMVFGNLGSPSGSGVAFTRNPTTGEPGLYGEYLEGGQGEEVVAGTRTPEPLAEAARRLPELFEDFERMALRLEQQRKDVLDLEFTVERGRLYLLQVRSAKRTPNASVRIAADLLAEGVVSPLEALSGVTPGQIRDVERPRFAPAALADARAGGRLLVKGIAASVGHAHGVAVLDPDRAEAIAAEGENVILLRETTSPFDLHGMIASTGIVTARGGATSHAAVVARALGRPAVVGCADLGIDVDGRTFSVGSRRFAEGTGLSVDGAGGDVFEGIVPLSQPASSSTGLGDVLRVAREAAGNCRILGLCTTPGQVTETLERGADGIGIRLIDLLVASGAIEQLADELSAQRHRDQVDLSRLEPTLAELLVPVFEAARRVPVVVRAIDLIDGDAGEFLDLESLLVAHPGVGLPVGLGELLRFQVAALARACGETGDMLTPYFVVRHLSDPRELAMLEELAARQLSREGRGELEVGALVSTPLGIEKAAELAERSRVLWLDAHRLMVGSSGYPAVVFTSAEPLDEYMRKGWLAEDPRLGQDRLQQRIFTSLTTVRIGVPDCQIGVRMGRAQSPELLDAYFRAGARIFILEPEDLRVAIVELGKAALRQASDVEVFAGASGG
ncbi:MAG: pyruvate, phosphate dikinase [bacterium]|nr:pyruvate, phosphate dikinase [bacterium]